MTIRFRTLFTALAMALTLGPSQLVAQTGNRPPRQQMERQLRERFDAMIVQRVGLNEAEAVRVREIGGELMQQRRELARRELRLQRELRAVGTELGEERATELLSEILSIQEEELRLRNEEVERLREVLDDRRVLILLQVREEMGRRIREVRGRREGGGGGTPGPGGPFLR